LTEKEDLNLKFIIAPHDTGPNRIRQILDKMNQPSILYSSLTEANANSANILIIDGVGVLSKLYRYATVAFIGGGFGSGLHNIQEPVTFGVPVFFGPVYHKFSEARELVERGGASSINSTTELMVKTRKLLDSPPEHQRISAICRDYVEENRGATARIMGYLEQMV
jgi:3-deoxy-D-manno-octulosonic-acid transferase